MPACGEVRVAVGVPYVGYLLEGSMPFVQLAAFMASILVVWAMELVDHTGLVHHDHGLAAHA